MKQERPKSRVPELLREAYPNLSEAEQKEAHRNLKRFLEVCRRIYERQQSERRETETDDDI